MTMRSADINGFHKLQDIILSNIQRKKPRLGLNLKEMWQRAAVITKMNSSQSTHHSCKFDYIFIPNCCKYKNILKKYSYTN